MSRITTSSSISHVQSVLFEGALELLWPTRCVVCDCPGELLCKSCREALPWINQRWACPYCGAPFGRLTCTECARNWPVAASVAALTFEGAGAKIITTFKDQHELRLAPVIAAVMEAALIEAEAWCTRAGTPRIQLSRFDALSFVPATAKAFSRRGFDHMELVARELCALIGLPLADVLVRSSRFDQRELSKEERAQNLKGSIGVIDDVQGLTLLLADDVITTGASINECARALLERGAKEVCAVALARVW